MPQSGLTDKKDRYKGGVGKNAEKVKGGERKRKSDILPQLFGKN